MKPVVYVTEKAVKQRRKKYLGGLFSHESNLFNIYLISILVTYLII